MEQGTMGHSSALCVVDNLVSTPQRIEQPTYVQSEPRNYAPITSGQSVMGQPPPKFALPSLPRTPPRTEVQSRCNSEQGTPQHGALAPATQFCNSVAQYLWNNGIHVGDMLSRLTATPSGLPSLEIAMSPEFYPFVEGGKLARPMNNGVVKLRNVSAPQAVLNHT